jgi:hypothetical protein
VDPLGGQLPTRGSQAAPDYPFLEGQFPMGLPQEQGAETGKSRIGDCLVEGFGSAAVLPDHVKERRILWVLWNDGFAMAAKYADDGQRTL